MNTKSIAKVIAAISIIAGIVLLGLTVRVIFNSNIGYWSWAELLPLYLDMGIGFGLIGIGGIIFAVLPEETIKGPKKEKKED